MPLTPHRSSLFFKSCSDLNIDASFDDERKYETDSTLYCLLAFVLCSFFRYMSVATVLTLKD